MLSQTSGDLCGVAPVPTAIYSPELSQTGEKRSQMWSNGKTFLQSF